MVRYSYSTDATYRKTFSSHNGSQISNRSVPSSSSSRILSYSWKSSHGDVDEEENGLINRILPKELLLRIFSHLDVVSLCRCAQVSKAWNILALDGLNWQRVDFFEFQVDIKSKVVENLALRCGGFLRELSLRGCQAVGDAALATFSRQCKNIEALNLQLCTKITDRTCQSLAHHCHKLQRLDISSCSFITDVSLNALAQGCPGLTHLDVSWCNLISGYGIKALAKGCRRLASLTAKGCHHIHDDALIYLSRHCPDLFKVNFHSCRHIQDEGIIKLAENCRNLTYLTISNCHLTDSSLLAVAKNCRDLKTLECSAVSQFTDAGFEALAKNCTLLERIDMEECVLISDSTLALLASNCPLIKSVTLSHCELITDEGIRQLATSPGAAEHLSVLELDNLPLITDVSLSYLRSCRNLRRVGLYDCQMITRSGIRRLRSHLPSVKVHAYFAPFTPPLTPQGSREHFFQCCTIL